MMIIVITVHQLLAKWIPQGDKERDVSMVIICNRQLLHIWVCWFGAAGLLAEGCPCFVSCQGFIWDMFLAFCLSFIPSSLSVPLSPSLFPVLSRSLRHLWLLRQEVSEHHHLLLWDASRLLHHTFFSSRGDESVRPSDEAGHQGPTGVISGILQMGEVCLLVWQWQR